LVRIGDSGGEGIALSPLEIAAVCFGLANVALIVGKSVAFAG
jgi:hypothetical protein